MLAVAFGFLGAVIIINPKNPTFGFDAISWLLISMLCLCSNTLLARRFSTEAPPMVVTLAVHFLMLILMTPILYFKWIDISNALVLAQLIGIGVSGGLGVLFFNLALESGEASFVAPFYYTELLWAVMFDFVVWMIIPEVRVLVGALIIVVMGLYVHYYESKRSFV